MKKLLLALAFFGGAASTSFAQTGNKSKFSIGVEAGAPVGYIKDEQGFATGASLKYALPITKNTAFTASFGITSFQGKDIPGYSDYAPYNTGTLQYLPLKAGIKYNPIAGLYGEAQIGGALGLRNDYLIAFVYSPGIGYNFSDVIDLGVRYEAWSLARGVIGQATARLSYCF